MEEVAEEWLYFGCWARSGHYLHLPGGKELSSSHPLRVLEKFDGMLCHPRSEGLFVAALSRLGGIGYSALAWWGETGDEIVFTRGLDVGFESFKMGLLTHFPRVWERLPSLTLRW